MQNRRLSYEFGAALFAAPLFCLLYTVLFGYEEIDPLWIFGQPETIFWLILFYPLVEEVVFRGFIQEGIEKKTVIYPAIWGISAANVITSILFVMMHLIHHPILWALLTFFPSMVFGYFKERYQSILPSILLHMFYNLSYFSLLTHGV